MLTIKELKKLSAKELADELVKATKDLFKIRFDVNNGSSKAHHEIRKMKKYRAQIKTAEYQLKAEKPAKETKAAKEEPKEMEEEKTSKKK